MEALKDKLLYELLQPSERTRHRSLQILLQSFVSALPDRARTRVGVPGYAL